MFLYGVGAQQTSASDASSRCWRLASAPAFADVLAAAAGRQGACRGACSSASARSCCCCSPARCWSPAIDKLIALGVAARARRSGSGTPPRCSTIRGASAAFVASLTGYRARPRCCRSSASPAYWVVVTWLPCAIARAVAPAQPRVDARPCTRPRSAAPRAAPGWRPTASGCSGIRASIRACNGSVVRASVRRPDLVPRCCRIPAAAADDAHAFNNLTVFAQWAFWGAVVAVRHPVDVHRRAHAGAACSVPKAR